MVLDGALDLNKLPAGKPANDELIKAVHLELTMSRDGAKFSLHLVSNPGYKGFAKDERGLKEWLELLLKQDKNTLAELVQYFQMIDSLAGQLVDGKMFN